MCYRTIISSILVQHSHIVSIVEVDDCHRVLTTSRFPHTYEVVRFQGDVCERDGIWLDAQSSELDVL